MGTILIKTTTRERLKQIGNKGQTYDDLINRLINMLKENKNIMIDPLDHGFESLRSSGSIIQSP